MHVHQYVAIEDAHQRFKFKIAGRRLGVFARLVFFVVVIPLGFVIGGLDPGGAVAGHIAHAGHR